MSDVFANAVMGHNNPPSRAQFVSETAVTIGAFLKDHPVIQTEEEAKAYKLLRDQGKLALADMEDERKSKNRVHETAIKQNNDEYRGPRVLLEKVLGEGDSRVEVWMRQEEEKRKRIKEEAWAKVQKIEEAAREAAEREQEAKEAASMGVETDVLSASRDTDAAEQALGRARREALRAERNEGVKIAGGHRRALSARETVEFIITDPILTVKDVGWSERVLKALESDVREYYQKFSTAPKGVKIATERKVQ